MTASHDMLFGVLALQAGLIDPPRFAEACTAWADCMDQPLSDLLVERGWLSASERAAVDQMLQRKLPSHSGDAQPDRLLPTTDHVRQDPSGFNEAEPRQGAAGWPLDATAGRSRYPRMRLHATGGIGRVWVAKDEHLGREVALKELRPERADSPEAVARFVEEARITGQLEHPGIVPVYELAPSGEGGRPFFAMQLVAGRTLADAVKTYHEQHSGWPRTRRLLELQALLGAFVAVCNAVAYAHSQRVIHRDLKPQNVVLGEFGEVMVLDWGLAKVIGRTGGDAYLLPVAASGDEPRDGTQMGQVVGTPAYMAPEQAQGRPDLVDGRTDIYGLGAILTGMAVP
jgi:tRNA A-37 threonylcarbamoyl transferase component Bud32